MFVNKQPSNLAFAPCETSCKLIAAERKVIKSCMKENLILIYIHAE